MFGKKVAHVAKEKKTYRASMQTEHVNRTTPKLNSFQSSARQGDGDKKYK
jgi:hypothetical protein